jgi:diguanylate cyclase (GGDEF)-like protein
LWENRDGRYLLFVVATADQAYMATAAASEEVPPEASGDPDIQRDFWLSHIRIGFGIFVGESAFVMVYLGLTPHGEHRTLLWIVAAFWFVSGVINFLAAPRLASMRWRVQFSATWNILASFAVAGFVTFDGGLHSPVILLLFLPAASAALTFSPWLAGTVGACTIVATAYVWTVVPNPGVSAQAALMLFACLAGSVVLAVTASVSRANRERQEQLLVDKIAELATTDGLTGCVVRRVFYERLDEEIARSMRHGDDLSLMLIDVDTFKAVNDTYGHVVGDHVLAAIGATIRAQTRAFDVIGRLGGDEFAVLMPTTEPSAAVVLAERIRDVAASAAEIPVTLSIGVSDLDPTEPTSERIIDAADFALYQVKGDGRDGVAVRDSKTSVPNPSVGTKRTVPRSQPSTVRVGAGAGDR